jgi:ferredoxin
MVTRRLAVNPILCTGHAVCAELVPELIAMDPWGYPLVSRDELTDELMPHARRAINSCPALALLVDEGTPRRHSSRPPL